MFPGHQDLLARPSGSTEHQRVFSGQQDLQARSSGSTEQHRVFPGQQDLQARSSGNTEQHRVFSGLPAEAQSRQLKQDNVIKKDSKPSVAPLVIRKEEHREDPRLKMRRPLDEEPSIGFKPSNVPKPSHGTPYNAQEASNAQSVKLDSISVPSVAMSKSLSTSQYYKYQVNDKFLREVLEKVKSQQGEESAYKVTVNDGTRKALEMMKQQEGAKSSKPELQDAKMNERNAKPVGKLVTTICTSDEKSVKRSGSSVSATQEKGKRIKIDQGNPVSENVSAVTARVPTLPSAGQPTKYNESRKGEKQIPAKRSGKKPCVKKQVKEPPKHKDSSSGQEIKKPVVQTPVPELLEAPFPAIPTCNTLTSPPSSSSRMSKAPKLKLILASDKRDLKEVSAQLPSGDSDESFEHKPEKQPIETEHEQNGDLQRDRKSIDSPVAMDISPQYTTTPCLSGSVSPITVVSSKGRYQSPVPPSAASTTPVHSSQAYSLPVSSGFPFTPPIPQGPYRSSVGIGPFSSQPRPPISQPPVNPMPFVPPLSSALSSGTIPSLPGALPVLQSPSVSSAPSAGSLPFGTPMQAGSSFIPHSAIPPGPVVSPAISVPLTMGTFAGSPSFPPLPPARPASHQRKNSLDALSDVVSSLGGQYSITFPGLPHNQRFGFPTNMAPPGVVAMSPNTSLPPPVLPPPAGRPPHVFPQQLGGPSQNTPFPGPAAKMTVVQPQRVGFVPIGIPRFHVQPVLPTGPASPQLGGVSVVPQMNPVHPMFGTVPLPRQFQPRLPFQQPPPVGFWVAPFKMPFVPSGISTAHMGRMPYQSAGQKHPMESKSSLPQKNADPEKDLAKKDLSVGKLLKEDENQNNKNSKDTGSEGPKGDASDQKAVDKAISSAELVKQKEVALSKSELTSVNNPKENKAITASSNDKKATSSKDKEITSEAVDESVIGNVKQLSGNTEEEKVEDSEKLRCDQTSDSTCSKENADRIEGKAYSEGSTKQKDEGLAKNEGVDDVSRKIDTKAEEPCQVPVGELQISSSQGTTAELSGNFVDNHSNVLVTGSSTEVVEVDLSLHLPITTYQTEAERKGSNAVSKIYDILRRRNAEESRSETDSADQEAEDPDEPDKPDPSAIGEELNADEEGGNRKKLESY